MDGRWGEVEVVKYWGASGKERQPQHICIFRKHRKKVTLILAINMNVDTNVIFTLQF